MSFVVNQPNEKTFYFTKSPNMEFNYFLNHNKNKDIVEKHSLFIDSTSNVLMGRIFYEEETLSKLKENKNDFEKAFKDATLFFPNKSLTEKEFELASEEDVFYLCCDFEYNHKAKPGFTALNQLTVGFCELTKKQTKEMMFFFNEKNSNETQRKFLIFNKKEGVLFDEDHLLYLMMIS